MYHTTVPIPNVKLMYNMIILGRHWVLTINLIQNIQTHCRECGWTLVLGLLETLFRKHVNVEPGILYRKSHLKTFHKWSQDFQHYESLEFLEKFKYKKFFLKVPYL